MVGLDPQHARVVKDVLKERSLAGMTVLVSTHQLEIAEEMADRIGIIHGGKLIAVGTREELRQTKRLVRRAGGNFPVAHGGGEIKLPDLAGQKTTFFLPTIAHAARCGCSLR